MRLYQLTTLAFTLALVACCPGDDANCIHCFGTVCLECANSFVNQNGLCVVPTTAVPFCISYARNGVCNQCQFGYSLNNGLCQAISSVSGCLSLDDNGACEFCNRGWLIQANGCFNNNTCADPNCALCTYKEGIQVCGYCVSGFTVFARPDGTTKCIQQYPALYNCRVADFNDVTQCRICHFGFASINGFCTPANSTQNVNLNFDYSSAMRNAVLGVTLSVLFAHML